MNERLITAFFHKRACAFVMVLTAIIASLVAYYEAHGITAWIWSGDRLQSFVASVTVNLASAVTMVFINKRFNIMRSISYLSAGVFAFMLASVPEIGCCFSDGTILCCVLLLCTMLLFSTYGDTSERRHVFLLFFILSAASFINYAFAFYIPVMLVGCIQMRIFSFKTFLAAGIGVITSPWIIFGFGIVNPLDITLPDIDTVFSAPSLNPSLLVAAVVTIIAGLGFMSGNLIKIIAYNARIRGFNGFMAVTFVVTALLTVLDFNNCKAYMPLLFAMTSYQITLFFSSRRYVRSYIGILSLMTVYCLIYAWNLWK